MNQQNEKANVHGKQVDTDSCPVDVKSESKLREVQIDLLGLCDKPITNWADVADEPPHLQVTPPNAESTNASDTVNNPSYAQQSCGNCASATESGEVNHRQDASLDSRAKTPEDTESLSINASETRGQSNSLEKVNQVNDQVNDEETKVSTVEITDVTIESRDMNSRVDIRVASENSYNTANLDDEELDDDIDDDDTYETVDSDVSDNLFRDGASEESDFASPELLDASSRTPCRSRLGEDERQSPQEPAIDSKDTSTGAGNTVESATSSSSPPPSLPQQQQQLTISTNENENENKKPQAGGEIGNENETEASTALPSQVNDASSESSLVTTSLASKSPKSSSESNNKKSAARIKPNVASNLPSTKSSLVSTSSSSVGTLPSSHQPRSSIDDEEEIKRKPQYIPKRGAFYEHDDRLGSDEVETSAEVIKTASTILSTSSNFNSSSENTPGNESNSTYSTSAVNSTSDKIKQSIHQIISSLSGQVEPTSGSIIEVTEQNKSKSRTSPESNVESVATAFSTGSSTCVTSSTATSSSALFNTSSGNTTSMTNSSLSKPSNESKHHHPNQQQQLQQAQHQQHQNQQQQIHNQQQQQHQQNSSLGKQVHTTVFHSSSSNHNNNHRSHYHSSHYYHHSNNYYKSSFNRGNIEADRWGHDLFNEHEQQPKSNEELYTTYGYDIRSNDSVPAKSNPLVGNNVHGSNYGGNSGGGGKKGYNKFNKSRNWQSGTPDDESASANHVFYPSKSRPGKGGKRPPVNHSHATNVHESSNSLADGKTASSLNSTTTAPTTTSNALSGSNSTSSPSAASSNVINQKNESSIHYNSAAAAKIAAREAHQASEKLRYEREKQQQQPHQQQHQQQPHHRNTSEDRSFHYPQQQYLNSNIYRRSNNRSKRSDSNDHRNNHRGSRGAVFNKDDFSTDLGGMKDQQVNKKLSTGGTDDSSAKFTKKFSQVVEDRASPLVQLVVGQSLTITSSNYPNLVQELVNDSRMVNGGGQGVSHQSDSLRTKNEPRNEKKQIRKDSQQSMNDSKTRPGRNTGRKVQRNELTMVNSPSVDSIDEKQPLANLQIAPSTAAAVVVHQHPHQYQHQPPPQQQPQPLQQLLPQQQPPQSQLQSQQQPPQAQQQQQQQQPQQTTQQTPQTTQQQPPQTLPMVQQQQLSSQSPPQRSTLAPHPIVPSVADHSAAQAALLIQAPSVSIPTDHTGPGTPPTGDPMAQQPAPHYYDPTVVAAVQHPAMAQASQATHQPSAPTHPPELMAYGHADAMASAYTAYNTPYLVGNQLSYMHPPGATAGASAMPVCPSAYLSTYPPSGFPSYPPQYHGHTLAAHPPATASLPGPHPTSGPASAPSNPSAGEIFRGGVTYYDTSAQQPLRSLPPKRTKNILPIVPPPNYTTAQVDSSGEM